jgi:hypothetical protein
MTLQTIGIKFEAGDLNRGVQASTQTLDKLGASAKKTGTDVDAMIARMKASNLAQIQAAESAARAGGALQDMGGKAAAAASSTGLLSGALGLIARGGAIIIAAETGMRVLGAAYEYVARKSIELDDANRKASDGLRQQAERDVPALAKAYIALNATLDRQIQLRERVSVLDRVASVSDRAGSLIGGIFPTLGSAIRGVGGVASVVGGQTRDALTEEQSRTGLARRGISDAQLGKDADLLRTFTTARKLGIETATLTAQAGEAAARLRGIVGDVTQTVERRTEAQTALNLLIEKQSKADKAAAKEADAHKDAIARIIEAQQRQLVTTTEGANAWALYELKLNGATAAQMDQYVATASAIDQFKTFTAAYDKVIEVLDRANPGRLTPTVRGDNSRGLYNPVVEVGPVIGKLDKASKTSADYFTETWQRAAFDVGRTLTDTFRSFFDGTRSALDTLLAGLNSVASSVLGAVVNKGIGSLIGANVLHAGGQAGAAGSTRNVSPLLFAGAQRYHTGGMAGLAPDEVPAILQRGETVIPKGGATAMRGGSVTVNLNVSSLDPQTARDLVLREMPTILKSVGDAASRSRVYRAQLAGG